MFDLNWEELLNNDLDRLIQQSGFGAIDGQEIVHLTPGERRFVSVLFIDMKGFMAMMEKSDQQQVATILQKAHTIVRKLIEIRGGWLEKFEGTAIMAGFGVKITHEDDAVRALDAALAVMSSFDALKSYFDDLEIITGIRCGIHSGEVTRSQRGNQDVIVGDTVNIAARLQQSAPVHTILISEATRKLAGDRFSYQDHPPLTVKGKSHPINVFILTGAAPRNERWKRSRMAADTPFIGRQNQLDTLFHQYDSCRRMKLQPDDDIPHHILIDLIGEPGMGKSRLLHEFVKQLRQNRSPGDVPAPIPVTSPSIMRGYAASFAARPYNTIIYMIMDYLGISDIGSEMKIRFEALWEYLYRQFPDDPELEKSLPMLGLILGIPYEDSRIEHLEPSKLQIEIVIAFRTFIERLAKMNWDHLQEPFLMIWDDFHWIDDPSMTVLASLLMQARTPVPMMFVVSHRPERTVDALAVPPDRLIRMKLEPLSEAEQLSLIHGMLGPIDIPAPFQTMLFEKGAGNPYFVEEFILYCIEKEILTEKDGIWLFGKTDTSIRVPTTLRNLITARIDALQTELKHILQHASVLGKDFYYQTFELIEQKLTPRFDPKDSLDELVMVSFLISSMEDYDISYIFKHILTWEVTYESLLNRNKMIIHRLCAQVIEERYAGNLQNFYFELGEHWLASGNLSRSLDYFKKTAQYCQTRFDNQGTINALTKIIAHAPDEEPLKAESLMNRGDVYKRIGNKQRAFQDYRWRLILGIKQKDIKGTADALRNIGLIHYLSAKYPLALRTFEVSLDLSRRIDDLKGQAATMNAMGFAYRDISQYADATNCLNQAYEISQQIGDLRESIFSMNSLGQIQYQQSEFSTALEYFEKCLDIARKIQARDRELSALVAIGNTYLQVGQTPLSKKYMFSALRIAVEMGDRKAESTIYTNLGNSFYRMDEFDDASRYYEMAITIANQIGSRQDLMTTLGMLGVLCESRYEFQKAMELYRKAYKLSIETGVIKNQGFCIKSMGMLYYDMGDLDQSADYLEKALTLVRSVRDRQSEKEVLEAMGLTYWRMGELEKALQCATRAASLAGEMGLIDKQYIIQSIVCLVMLDLGEFEAVDTMSRQIIRDWDVLSKDRWLEDNRMLFVRYTILKDTDPHQALELLGMAYSRLERMWLNRPPEIECKGKLFHTF